MTSSSTCRPERISADIDHLLRMQLAHDVAHHRQRKDVKIKRFEPV
jgi:hypothetical protein